MRGSECVMVVSVQGCSVFMWRCVTVFGWLGSRWESFLAQKPRAADRPIPQPTPRLRGGSGRRVGSYSYYDLHW